MANPTLLTGRAQQLNCPKFSGLFRPLPALGVDFEVVSRTFSQIDQVGVSLGTFFKFGVRLGPF